MRRFEFEMLDIDDDDLVIKSKNQPEEPETPEPDPEPPAPTFSEEEMEAAKADAYALGKADGIGEVESAMRASQDTRLEALLNNLSERLHMLENAEELRCAEACSDAISLASSVAHKILPGYIEKYGEDEIASLIKSCVEERMEEQRLVVRLPDSMLDAVRDRLDQLTTQRGFEGKVILIGEPGLSGSDCAIEWADGGAVRDSGKSLRTITDIMEESRLSINAKRDIDPEASEAPKNLENPGEPWGREQRPAPAQQPAHRSASAHASNGQQEDEQTQPDHPAGLDFSA